MALTDALLAALVVAAVALPLLAHDLRLLRDVRGLQQRQAVLLALTIWSDAVLDGMPPAEASVRLQGSLPWTRVRHVAPHLHVVWPEGEIRWFLPYNAGMSLPPS